MGPIWTTRILDNPYGTHAKSSCTPHMGPIWVVHMGHIYALTYLLDLLDVDIIVG